MTTHFTDPIFNIKHTVIELIIRELYAVTGNRAMKKQDAFVESNNAFYNDPSKHGGIIFGGKTFFSSNVGSQWLQAYTVHPKIEQEYSKFRHAVDCHEVEKQYTRRLLSTLFNINPNLQQLTEAIGAQLVGAVQSALTAEANKAFRVTWTERPPSAEFPAFYEKHREYFKQIQEQVIRNLLTKNQTGETQ